MTNKMNNNKQDSMKLQTCVLKVDIPCPCDGCKQKIKTVLKKIGGVEKTSIDLEQEKVTVYGNADPVTLIKKLSKSGKHAELWVPQKGSGGGKGNQQMQATNNKGFKDFNPSNKNQKFDITLGGGGGGGGRFNECDEDDDSCDGHDFKKPNKMMTGPGVGGRGPVGMMNGKNGPSGGFDLDVQLKGKGGNNDAKKGNGGKKGGGGDDGGGKNGKKSKGGGFFGGMICKALFGGGKKKHGDSNSKGGKNGSGGKMKDGGLDKKGGGKPEGKFSSDKQNEFLEFSKPGNGGCCGDGVRRMGHNCGNGGWNNNQMGGNPMMPPMGNYPMGGHPMGPMGGYPMGQMQPMAYRGQGMVNGSVYNQQQYQQQYHQQQYMQPMMMMNQPKANMYPQMMYGQPPPSASAYGPPMGAPMNDGMAHMFSDENTDGCSIM